MAGTFLPFQQLIQRRRRWLRWFGWLTASYIAVIVVLMLLENRLIFKPSGSDNWLPAPAGIPVEEVWMATADGTPIHARWFPRIGATGALLYCHGKSGNISHRTSAVRELLDGLKESVLIFDYPGYGKSGGEPSEAGCYAAADAAYDWLIEERRIAPSRIILFGKSLGGGVATEIASRREHRVLVLVKTFTSMVDMGQRRFPFVPARWLVRNRFDNLGKIGACRGPIFIAHGECDQLIPLSQGQELFAAAAEPKRFFIMKGCGHSGELTPDLLNSLRDFLEQEAPLQPSSD
jgi:fermentation-respiration switch protein FrsA (DUF1100 family)